MWSACYSGHIVIILNFLKIFSKNTQISDFKKIRLMAAELFHADRRIDMTKLTADFRNFTKAPRKDSPEYNEHKLKI